MAGVGSGAALLIAMEEILPGSHTLSWANISLIMNAVFMDSKY